MKTDVAFVRSESDRAAPRGLFVPIGYTRSSPRKRYIVRIKSSKDARRAARLGIPVGVLEARAIRRLGYSVDFPPKLLVWKFVEGAVESSLKMVRFVREEAVRSPTNEDLIVAMLRLDWLGCRRLVERNRRHLDLPYLRTRILEEGLSRQASRVRLDDYVGKLPDSDRALPRRELTALNRPVTRVR